MSYENYLAHITAYEREFKPWEVRVERIVQKYRTGKPGTDRDGERGGPSTFNVLWSNVQTLKAATYARTPMPDVSRRFKDNDPVGRVAALLLERSLEFDVRHFRDYAASLAQVTYDRFLGGRGVAWIRYEPTFEPMEGQEVTEDAETETQTAEQIVDEHCPTDYVHWRDFGHAIARTWEECNLVWRKVYLTGPEAKKRFPDESLPLDTSPDDEKSVRSSTETNAVNKRALVYELWDKETGKAVWLSTSLGKIIDEKEDPLGLEEFFPTPPPLYSTLTTDSLIPVPDFILYQDQANELDVLADRIDGLVKALKVVGVYDASITVLRRIFTESDNNELQPVDNWAAFAEKKGLAGAIDLVDILPIAQALGEAYKAFEQVKGQIYELTGISDILRGQTAPSETATAQQIKNSYASLRLKVYQDEVERYAARLLQLKAQVICNHFDPQTILKLAAAEQLSPDDQQYIGPALGMLKSGVTRSFRIEIETDSMVYQDEQQEKQDRMEFLQASGQFLQSLMQLSQEAPALAPAAAEIFKFGITGFRVGKSLEGTLDQMAEQLKAMAQQAMRQPKPNPEAMKAQAAQGVAQVKVQGDLQENQQSEQAETQRHQMTLQAQQAQQRQDQAHEAQMAAIDARNQHAADQMKEAFDMRMAQMQQIAQKQTDMTNAMLQQILQRMKGDTAIEVAEIGAQTTLDAAQVSAARSADA